MSLTIRDYATGATRTVKAQVDGSSEYIPHHNIDWFTVAHPDSMVRSTASTSDTLAHDLIAAPSGSPDLSLRNYISAIQVANKGGSAALISIYDGPSSPDVALAYIYCPAGNTVAVYYPIPLKASVGNAVRFSADASSTTIYVSAQGYTNT